MRKLRPRLVESQYIQGEIRFVLQCLTRERRNRRVLLPAEVNAWNRYQRAMERSRKAETPERRRKIIAKARANYWWEMGKIYDQQHVLDPTAPPVNPHKHHPITGKCLWSDLSRSD